MRVLEQLCVAERPGHGIYATMSIAEVAADRTAVTLTSAGHPEPLLLSGARAVLCEVDHGTPVGLLPEFSAWKTTHIPLPRRGGLLLYTDGLVECFSGEGRQRLGTEGLVALCAGMGDLEPEELLDDLMDRVQSADRGRNHDDLAMLYLAWERS